MADRNGEWEDLGRSIEKIIDQAVNSRNFQELEKTIRSAVDAGSDAVRRATRPAVVEYKEKKAKKPVLYGSTGGRHTKGVLKIVGGAIAEIAALALLGAGETVGMIPFAGAASLVLNVLGVTAFAGGLWLILSGGSTVKMLGRFKAYKRILGEKTHCSIERLARGVGKSVKFVRRELGRMIGEGLFLEGHIDREGASLITSHETYAQYEQARLQLQQRQAEEAKKPAAAHTPQVQEVLDKGNAFIAQIRRCNDDIPGEEISSKISRMELIVGRIFERAEAHPEVVPDLKKLMDYYLPMTVKLLNAYADMDAQPVQGETIVSSKREIEATLDTLNQAFEKLLDDLFADTAMDVSSDISVLNTLLAQEGLTGSDFNI